MPIDTPIKTPSNEMIQTQLDRILASQEFRESPRSKELFRFVVDETLIGNGKTLSQRTIARKVYGRDKKHFDPVCDPIVRVQAGRLRQQLEHYNITVGLSDPIEINLPKGRYVPAFNLKKRDPVKIGWPTLLIQPFVNLSKQPETELLALGLPSDLAAEFNLYSDIEVFIPLSAVIKEEEYPTQFLLEGTVSLHQQKLQINVHLLDRASRRQIWAHRHRCESVNQYANEKDQLVQLIAASIAEERGQVTRWMDKEISGQGVTVSETYEAILLYHRYDRAPSEKTFSLAFHGLRNAVDLDPDCGVCFSYLARLLVDAWALGPVHDSINESVILETAQKGVKLDPDNLRGRVISAYAYLATGHLKESRSELEIALKAVQSGHGIWLDGIGYLLTLCGDWDRGPKLIRQSLAVNPNPLTAASSALWLDALHRDDIDEMLKQSFIFEKSEIFWDPLMRSTSLVLAGRIPEAELEADRIQQCCPDFLTRGKWYIERFIKLTPLVDIIIENLTCAGLDLENPQS